MNDIGRQLETDILCAVFDSVGAGIFVVGPAGLITTSTPYPQQIVDRPGEQLLGADMHGLLHRDENGNEITHGVPSRAAGSLVCCASASA